MTTTRERARDELTAEILASARRQLAEVGPAALSLRAVARDIGKVSSAVYRYVASRDDLLTALIVACYDELGAAVEAADRPEESPRGRWRAACAAIRDWSAAHPHEYALLYGSPVPGYSAPRDTVGPATRPTAVLVRIVVDDRLARPRDGSGARTDLYEPVRAFVRETIGEASAAVLDDDLVERTLSAWITVFGAVSFDRFGHLVGVTADTDRYFDRVVEDLANRLELSGTEVSASSATR
ncbi:TetR/AcrR family transcriptional regulator [Rhodococcoides kroppenstedtii]|uniref:TetR/AcrR family transcriptional regulator n=1 Tax=Rhodococcoides kroppenstedtii TaxID=293050 RepID=UPI0036262620